MDFPGEAIGPNQRGLEPQGSLLCRKHIVALQCYDPSELSFLFGAYRRQARDLAVHS